MPIYTKTGDAGQTGIIGGRVDKDDLRVEAYGTIDELNSVLGMAIAFMDAPSFEDIKERLLHIQHQLFDCGYELAQLRQGTGPFKVEDSMVEQLEAWIDAYEGETPELTRFILPGGNVVAAHLHAARTVCRRAERRVVSLAKGSPVNPSVLRYLNRLSDLLFVMARAANHRSSIADVEVQNGAEVFKKRR